MIKKLIQVVVPSNGTNGAEKPTWHEMTPGENKDMNDKTKDLLDSKISDPTICILVALFGDPHHIANKDGVGLYQKANNDLALKARLGDYYNLLGRYLVDVELIVHHNVHE